MYQSVIDIEHIKTAT